MKKKIKALIGSRDGWRASCLELRSERMRTPGVVFVNGVPQELHESRVSSLVQSNDLVNMVHLNMIANLKLKVEMLTAQQKKSETCGA